MPIICGCARGRFVLYQTGVFLGTKMLIPYFAPHVAEMTGTTPHTVSRILRLAAVAYTEFF